MPNSVARAVLFGDPVLTPKGGPSVGVIAVAKKDLQPGETIEDFGGYEVYGVADNIDVVRRDKLLPVGLALGCKLKRAVAKDAVLTFDDVEFPSGRLVDRLYAEQEALFG